MISSHVPSVDLLFLIATTISKYDDDDASETTKHQKCYSWQKSHVSSKSKAEASLINSKLDAKADRQNEKRL